jgi:O-antigen/teichoic acid export membrane protein
MSEVRFTNLRHETVKGVSWSAVSQLVTQSFTWAISIVLARILGPKAYGLIGMTAVFTGFAGLFSDAGLADAIIQRKKLEKRHLDTAFWINVVIGGVITVLILALAPIIARFYSEPRLTQITQVISAQFFIGGLSVVQQALLRREMRFRDLAKIQIGTTAAAGVIGLIMALLGMGLWSLVGQMLAGSVFRLLFCWRVGDWRPNFAFDLQACKELFGFSAYVLGFYAVNYWARNADNLLVGRFIGARALGIYLRAYTLMLLPLTQVTNIVANVMTPALSSIQEDKARVRRSYLKAVSVVGLITFPMMTGCFVTADHLVLALLGHQWEEVVPIFRVLCGAGLLVSVTAPTGWIYKSQGRTDLQFKMGLAGAVGCVVAFIIGIHWGTLGVAWAYCIFSLTICYPVWAVCGHIIGLSFADMMRTLLPSFGCAVGMGFIVWEIGQVLPLSTPDWLHLVVQIFLGVFVYALLVKSFKLQAWEEARIAGMPMCGAAFTMATGLFRPCASLRWWARVR